MLILTGHLLKDPDFTIKFHRGDLFEESLVAKDAVATQLQRAPIILDADLGAVIDALNEAERSL